MRCAKQDFKKLPKKKKNQPIFSVSYEPESQIL